MQSNNSRFFDGFIMGALVGGAAFFLLGTEKGNKVLKVLSEDGFGDIANMFTDFEKGVEQGVKKTAKNIEEKEEKDLKVLEEEINNNVPRETETVHESKSKRFFRKRS